MKSWHNEEWKNGKIDLKKKICWRQQFFKDIENKKMKGKKEKFDFEELLFSPECVMDSKLS